MCGLCRNTGVLDSDGNPWYPPPRDAGADDDELAWLQLMCDTTPSKSEEYAASEPDVPLDEIEARLDAIFAAHRARADDNPDSMRYHQRDQGGSTYEDYRVMEQAAPLLALRERMRARLTPPVSRA